ncbi:MAG TPA: hypothetical protein VM536_06565, partial [Chloroflexia bacterium]|nr:hypothetical protein [Chloroflexia bacterium]
MEVMESTGIFSVDEFAPYLAEGANWRFFKAMLADCIHEAEPGRFLDVGSGLGFFVECCDRFGIPCEGLEGSAYAVAQASARGVRLTPFDLTSGAAFPYPSSTFSLVLL